MNGPAAVSPRALSPRVALAAIADRVVAEVPGVSLTDDGDPRWQTVDHDRRVRGVTAIAQGDGRYELGIHLTVAWPPDPLRQLAEDVRRGLIAAAERSGLADAVGEINVEIAAVEDPVSEVGRAS